MRNIVIVLGLLLLSSCFTKRRVEYITIKDTSITPDPVRVDTITKWNERVVTIVDTTKQMTITLERIKNNYIRVKADCEPKKIIVPVKKTIIKTKEVIVENKAYKYLSIFLFLLLVIGFIYNRISKFFV